ncbi:MAG: RNA polymerase sigma factor [Opitutales bacterium]|nr:RNA polymerase sigma factor [Opitutales bacterium]
MEYLGKETDSQIEWFEREINPHEQDVRNWLERRFSNIKDVDDVIQEAYSRIIKAYQSGPIVNPRAYLFVTARNIVLNRIRHYQYEKPAGYAELDPLSVVDEVTDPLASLSKAEEIELLISAIESLPKRCRKVLTLRKIYGLSQREVAKHLGISVNTVQVQTGEGIRRCVRYFKQLGYKTKFDR